MFNFSKKKFNNEHEASSEQAECNQLPFVIYPNRTDLFSVYAIARHVVNFPIICRFFESKFIYIACVSVCLYVCK